MDAEYKFDLMLEKLWAQGLIEDTKNKAQKVFYFNMIKKDFKHWLIETKECSEDNFYDKITEQNYLQFRKWQLAETEAKTKKLEIVIQLFGDNTINTINVIANPDKLKAILIKHNLQPSEAIKLIKVNGKKAFNPTFYNKCADIIINELKEIELGESRQEADDRLKRIESMIEKQTINKNADDVEENKAQLKEPENPFKRIFVNGYAYEMFEKLRIELTEEFPNVPLSNYSFIMQRMKEKKYLLENNHRKLIKFIDDNFNQKIGEDYFQFTNPTPKVKMQRFKRLNNEYQSKIEALLK
jgi:hypothetical protein